MIKLEPHPRFAILVKRLDRLHVEGRCIGPCVDFGVDFHQLQAGQIYEITPAYRAKFLGRLFHTTNIVYEFVRVEVEFTLGNNSMRVLVPESPKFAAMDRKKRLFNRVLFVSGGSAVLLFAGYLFFTHRPAQHFYIPEGYAGWVTVKFEKPGAPALPVKDGVVEYHIPPNGILETSTKLRTGWSNDHFYWDGASGSKEIPKHVDCNGKDCRWVHDIKEAPMDYDRMILSLPAMSDTLLWDGARISKTDNQAEVRAGRKTMLHFWVSSREEEFFYHHDSLPPQLAEW